MTTTASPSISGPTPPESSSALNPTRIDGWITEDLELVLQRAVDIANTAGHRQVRMEHVALAMLEDPYSPARAGWHGALTATQWQIKLSEQLAACPTQRHQPRQVTDIFCWRSMH
ncbi:hypothetical protein AB0H76_08395 [Nocardia sp. NPDC050712]|uniref:hypothetical protein n=1 Tax=Nocardia sp. NPDC050712 TaxID=3155518 RepID=UPI00340F03A5